MYRVLLAVALTFILLAQRATAWSLTQFDGRDYIPATEVAQFYELPNEQRNGENLEFTGKQRSLTLTRNSRVAVVNGITHWLGFPVLERDSVFFLSRLDLGKTIEPAFRPEHVEPLSPVTTVVLDAGHGGYDKGAASPFEFEKNFALDMARRVRDRLKKAGVRVVMTRNSDTFVELEDRAAVANRIPGSIFVSLHFNASDDNPSANGFEIFCVTPRGAPSSAYELPTQRDMLKESGNEKDLASFALANAIYHSMHGGMEMFDRGVKRARFAVLRHASVPAVLVEGGFLTNPGDARKVASRPWRDQYAETIARGILEFRRMASSRVPTRTVADYRANRPPVAATASAPQGTPAPDLTLRDLPGTN